MNDSHRHISKDGTVTMTGPDAMHFYRAVQLRSAISLYMKTGMIPTRGVTITKMLRAAKEYTGKIYGRSLPAYAIAIADLDVWIANMQTALPTTDEREEA